ncbi:hypothetical protein AAGQ96_09750 [Pantoea sp. MBD-2R]|uniref:hypothetical protein n=1 Tax=Pantoea sp. MBD-2R TaxID=3141540 RepID=UPI00318386C0
MDKLRQVRGRGSRNCALHVACHQPLQRRRGGLDAALDGAAGAELRLGVFVTVSAGQRVVVRFPLRPGIYFANAG